MKIVVLNGAPTAGALDEKLIQLKQLVENSDNDYIQFNLRDEDYRYCIGCWGCWVKTPGRCSNPDAADKIDRAIMNADFLLWASPLILGYPSELLKKAMDKMIPLIMPYFEVDHGESHHLGRYPKYPRVGLLLEPESTTDSEDLEIVKDLFCRTAINLKSHLEFSLTLETSATDLFQSIVTASPIPLPFPAKQKHIPGSRITPPKSVTFFNGSPRGKTGNTPIFLNEIAKGFGGEVCHYDLIQVKHTAEHIKAFEDAECVILGFPLYTDSMPGIVKHFIDALAPLTNSEKRPPIGFVVQSGFPESLHSRYIERYLAKLARRLGCPYLGTIVRGNGESTRVMPEQANAAMFKQLQLIGMSLASEGCFDEKAVRAVNLAERFPQFLSPLFKWFVRQPIAQSYFNDMLKKNEAFEKRFDTPYME